MPLSFHNVANIFVKMQQHRRRATEPGTDASTTDSKANPIDKGHHIVSTSGEGPMTHPSLVDIPPESGYKLRMEDFFVCSGGVDVPKLLRATRASLLGHAVELQGNGLIQEEWKCTICGPKNRKSGTFHVTIEYSALAIRSPIPTADPGKPVASENAKNVPGLMTIVQRRKVEQKG